MANLNDRNTQEHEQDERGTGYSGGDCDIFISHTVC